MLAKNRCECNGPASTPITTTLPNFKPNPTSGPALPGSPPVQHKKKALPWEQRLFSRSVPPSEPTPLFFVSFRFGSKHKKRPPSQAASSRSGLLKTLPNTYSVPFSAAFFIFSLA